MKPHLNKGLFSNYYLDELLPREEEFNIPFSNVEKALEETKRIWDKTYLSSLNEPQLRKHFLDKVFEILGWTIDVEPPTPSGEWSKHPDYALFHTREDLKIAQKATREDYFNKALCIGEAKRWGRPLDRKLKGEKDPFEVQNPSLQISRYLWLTGVKWGILTDGRYWRIFERESSKRLDIFYEIDLEGLIENGSIEDFKYFYLFFRRDAFPDFLEKVYKASVDYAEAVGEELKENVYKALKSLTQGFLSTPANKLKDTHLKEIHENSLILLYRLLFILYAEYRGLLPIGENRLYTESYSLDSLKKEIAGRLDKGEPIATLTYGYWNKLKELFEIMNIGNSDLGVPPYNGGLFDPEKHDFLEKYRIGNLYITKAVDLLSRSSDRAYIDYGSLEIRHLGSIYEGLLEYKLKIADKDIVPVKEKGKEVFIPVEEAAKKKKKVKEEEIVRDGEVYLVTDKGERKATGSYYTPDYIVKYIIENTLGPLVGRIYREIEWAQEIKNNKRNLNEIFEKIINENGEEDKENLIRLWELTRGNQERRDFLLNMLDGAQPSHGYDPIERILQLKVLDPAMGSGHFLVEATDFLARELLRILSGEPLGRSAKEMEIKEAQEPYGKTEPEEEDIRWARREVVERCIFGVDLNPLAVELGKLSLWLYTVSKNRPLNFLDHHLRCGNSLIGANIADLAKFPELNKKKAKKGPVQIGLFESVFREKISILLKSFELIETQPSDTVEQIREKERLYQDFRKIVSRFQDVADVWTSIYFGNVVDFGTYQRLQGELRSSDEEWEKLNQKPWFKKAKGIAKEKNFFHWNLEFPEVFERDQRKEKPGFDAVVGNPPYDVISEKEQEREVEGEKRFIALMKKYHPAVSGKLNFYKLFVCCSLDILCENGIHGFIVPMALLADKQARPLRKFMLEQNCFNQIEAFPQKDDPTKRVFKDAKLSTCVYVVRKSKPSPFTVRIHPEKDILKSSPSVKLDYEQIQEFDEKNLSVPCYPRITTQDFHLALKLVKVCQGNVLSNYAPSQQGEVNLTTHSEYLDKSPTGEVVLRGSHVDRYDFQKEPKQGIPMYLDVRRFLSSFGTNTKVMNHQYPRIGYQRGAAIDNWRRIIATIIEKNSFCSDTINFITNPNRLKLFTILGLLNSSLWEWRFRLTSTNNHVNAYEIDSMPIPPTSFVTPKQERKKLFEEAILDYQRYIETGKPNTFLLFIEGILLKEHQPDPNLGHKHNADPVNKNLQIKEDSLCDQSDVVHDILAFLAEQMIEINKDNQKETKGFLEWLESQLKIQPDKKGNTGIEALTGKTHIKNYLGDYQKGDEHLSFEGFWEILEKNKNRMQTNLKSREIFETVKTEYEKSLSRLIPIKEKLRKTDWLIDQIVYKLYGLTEDEIKLVENVL
ncbi:MAG: N-6 DNA methylase [Pseudomonadota bacterium]